MVSLRTRTNVPGGTPLAPSLSFVPTNDLAGLVVSAGPCEIRSQLKRVAASQNAQRIPQNARRNFLGEITYHLRNYNSLRATVDKRGNYFFIIAWNLA